MVIHVPYSGNVNWYQRETFIFCWRKNQHLDLFYIDFFSRSPIFVHARGDLLGPKFGGYHISGKSGFKLSYTK